MNEDKIEENYDNYECNVNDDENEENCDGDMNDEDKPKFSRGRLTRKKLWHQFMIESVPDVISLTGNLEFKAKLAE